MIYKNLIVKQEFEKEFTVISIKNTTNEVQEFEWKTMLQEPIHNIRMSVEKIDCNIKLGWTGKIFKWIDKRTWHYIEKLLKLYGSNFSSQYRHSLTFIFKKSSTKFFPVNYISPYQEQDYIVDLPIGIAKGDVNLKLPIEPNMNVTLILYFSDGKSNSTHRKIPLTGVPIHTFTS